MNLAFCHLILLAQQEIIDGIRQGMQPESARGNDLYILLLGGLVLLLLLVVLRVFQSRPNHSRMAPPPDHLAAACVALTLNRQEQADILHLARKARITYPVSMLLSPANLRAAIDRGIPADDKSGLRTRLYAISNRIFIPSNRPT
ncbi:MAG: hypothetical protein ABIG44_03080 [Planctomycetota bacterium]